MSISNSVGQPSRLKYGIFDSDHRPKALKTFGLSSSSHSADAKLCKGVRVSEISKYQFDHKYRNPQNIMRKQKVVSPLLFCFFHLTSLQKMMQCLPHKGFPVVPVTRSVMDYI